MGRLRDVAPPRVASEIQLRVGPLCLCNGPGMTIDTEYASAARGNGPRGPGRACSTSDVEDQFRLRRLGVDGTHNPVDCQEVEWRVEQCERRSLSSAVESMVYGDATPLHVSGRQCPQRTRDFRNAKVGQVSRFERGQPAAE